MDASLQKPEQNIKGQPSEVKEDYIASAAKEDESPKKRPNIVGIQGFSEGVEDQPEIDSPMRRKKKGGLDKLKISQEPCEAPAPEKNKFENLEKKF